MTQSLPAPVANDRSRNCRAQGCQDPHSQKKKVKIHPIAVFPLQSLLFLLSFLKSFPFGLSPYYSRNRFLVRFGCLLSSSFLLLFSLRASWRTLLSLLLFCPYLHFRFIIPELEPFSRGSASPPSPFPPFAGVRFLSFRESEEDPRCGRAPETSGRRGLTRSTTSAPAAPPSPLPPPPPTRSVSYLLFLSYRVICSSWIALGISMNNNRDSVGNYSNSEFMFSSTGRHSESYLIRELLLVEMRPVR